MAGGLARLSAVREDHCSSVLFRYYEKDGIEMRPPLENSLTGLTCFCRYKCSSERSLLRRFDMQEWLHDEVIQMVSDDCALVVDKFTWPDGLCTATHTYSVRASEDGHVERAHPGSWVVDYSGMRIVRSAIEDNMRTQEEETFKDFVEGKI